MTRGEWTILTGIALLAVGIWIAVFGWHVIPERTGGVPGVSSHVQADPCPQEARLAVLDKLWPVLKEPYPVTEQWLNEQDARISCISDWARTLSDNCMRVEYLGWLDFYAGLSRESRKALQDGTAASVQAKWERDRRDEKRRIMGYEAAHPVPAPPSSCERGVIRKVR